MRFNKPGLRVVARVVCQFNINRLLGDRLHSPRPAALFPTVLSGTRQRLLLGFSIGSCATPLDD